MRLHSFRKGDLVIYRKTKFGNHPGVRAKNISPVERGDGYTYNVDKFWVVADILEDGMLVLLTRRGKENLVAPDDLNLHHAQWWERIKYSRRFQQVMAALNHREAQAKSA